MRLRFADCNVTETALLGVAVSYPFQVSASGNDSTRKAHRDIVRRYWLPTCFWQWPTVAVIKPSLILILEERLCIGVYGLSEQAFGFTAFRAYRTR
jgi:hypothetical protein